ncbi:MAG: BrxE family protein [Planctomycetota bacterium]
MVVTQTSINTAQLMKLRLVVARFGEMDRAKWWNTKGMLTNLGEMAIHRGFPKTHLFARARAVFAVAANRCDEVFDPPNSITLWRLPPEVEDQIEDAWPGWLESPDEWSEFLNQVNEQAGGNLLDVLSSLTLASEANLEQAKRLKRADDARSVPLPAVREVTDETIALLAAGLWRGEPGKLAVPYARIDEVGP